MKFEGELVLFRIAGMEKALFRMAVVIPNLLAFRAIIYARDS